MEGSVIRCRLDLLVRLIDTTTGTAIEENNVIFTQDKKVLTPLYKGDGNYIFLNRGREDFILTVQGYGYEEKKVSVRYEELDENMPSRDVFLIPSENNMAGAPLLTMTGQLKNLVAVEAVNLSEILCYAKSYDAKKNRLSLFSSHRLNWDSIPYAVLKQSEGSFESFLIGKKISDEQVEPKEALKEELEENSPVCRVVFGECREDGNYYLRIRDNAENQQYLVCYIMAGKKEFRKVDFRNLEEERKAGKEDGAGSC